MKKIRLGNGCTTLLHLHVHLSSTVFWLTVPELIIAFNYICYCVCHFPFSDLIEFLWLTPSFIFVACTFNHLTGDEFIWKTAGAWSRPLYLSPQIPSLGLSCLQGVRRAYLPLVSQGYPSTRTCWFRLFDALDKLVVPYLLPSTPPMDPDQATQGDDVMDLTTDTEK